jgi:uncharacterized protein
MNLLDANVLIALHRADHEHHNAVTKWFQTLLEDGSPFGSPDLCWVAFLRLCSSPRVFVTPSPTKALTSFYASVTDQPNYLVVPSYPAQIAQTMALMQAHRATANLVNDAYLASFGILGGWSIASLDHDFARFPNIRWINPNTAA